MEDRAMATQDVFQDVKFRRGKNLRERIAESLEDLILKEELTDGKLPSERQLAKTYGVNQATISDAITLLEERGLVFRKHGYGTFIRDVTGHVLTDSFERFFVFKDCSFEDLVILRSILEPGVADLAARNASAEDLARLDDLSQKLIIYSEDRELAADYDAAFHKTLAEATHNKMIEAFMASIQQILNKYIHHEMREPRNPTVEMHHRLIYEAVVARDPNRARKIMEVHIQHLLQQIESQGIAHLAQEEKEVAAATAK